MTEKQPSNRHPTRRQVGQGSLRPPTGRPTNHPIGEYCTLVLGLAANFSSRGFPPLSRRKGTV